MRWLGDMFLLIRLLLFSKLVITIDEDFSGDDDGALSVTKTNEKRPSVKYNFGNTENREKSGGEKLHLIKQAVGELKSVLSKPIPKRTKSAILEQIFDAQGDPGKANLANEIFRKALEPSLPTHGAVGELGAEMIKISVLSKANKHFSIRTSPRLTLTHARTQNRKKSKAANVPTTRKMSSSEHVSRYKTKTTGFTTSRSRHNALRSRAKNKGNAYKLAWKYINKTLKSILARKRKSSKYELRAVINSTEDKKQYTLVKTKPKPTINLKGKTAKLLAVTVQHPKHSYQRQNHSLFNGSFRERKDYVIELDDSNNDNQEYDNGERRHLDSVVSLLRRLSLPSNGEVELVDDNEDKYSNDFDDGYISPQRRRLGENLFLSNYAEEDDDEDDVPPSDEQSYQRELERVNNDEELFEPHFDERDENEDEPLRYGEEENFFSDRPSINPYARMTDIGNDNKPVVTEYDVKKRNLIN